mmetsp:Transcript_4324/g.7500  ORF Transcript_4324/g.7500 Transcript_4324/m.7500 type:complete len:110 (-) Transcript_4324:573-902(-)
MSSQSYHFGLSKKVKSWRMTRRVKKSIYVCERCVCVVDVHMLCVDQTVLSSWRSLHRMVQPMASSCIKMDLLISSRCVLSFSLRTEDPSRDENEEREDGVGDTGAAING